MRAVSRLRLKGTRVFRNAFWNTANSRLHGASSLPWEDLRVAASRCFRWVSVFSQFNSQWFVTGALVCVGYYVGARAGLALTLQNHAVSVMWPPNAILLSAFLLTPVRAWGFLIIAALPAHFAVEIG